MRSKARILNEPIHPMLVHFPIAFLTGAVAFDIAGVVLDQLTLWTVGGYLAGVGILMALLAAVPGFIDYIYTVPPNSSGRKRATQHMVLNLIAVALYALAWFLRGDPAVQPDIPVIGLEVLGFGCLLVAGWMGSKLIYDNKAAVVTRYARAGRWSEESFSAKGGAIVVAKTNELQVDQMKLLRVDGERIVLGRTEQGYVAFDDRCVHKGGSLAGGAMICGTVQCPWHGSQFDVKDGSVRAGPADKPIRTYSVEERDGEVRLRL